ncbi:MAG: alpha-amylase/alpha-mannosidase (GH57 family) [Nitrospinales bacterium]|jgi:alpha-amylase/alpha-mannosidase (GH57 family)
MTKKFICLHAHFYQPPRENPWTQEIEIQESAAPYKNWNKKITEECYAPNAKARILGDDLRIKKIVNNYSRMSFNFGPTLLSWLESKSPETYQAILEADQESQKLFGGQGSALAQPYNHMIMPLANSRDKLTQIRWGIEDFKCRFKREPVGMWLPEAAVDIETLGLLADEGIRFTLLAPSQAKQIRSETNSNWVSVDENSLDTTRPYKLQLPSGLPFSIFFYDKNVSHQLAFENLLSNGDKFLNNLTSKFSTDTDKVELVHAATDGETYGHHHKFGDMTLAYVLDRVLRHDSYSLTNYAQFLENHASTWEVEILEDTSWSCAHGVERWRSNCGCHTGGKEGWSQAWRKPLRNSLDDLRDQFEGEFEKSLKPLLKDPWAARNDYIHLLQPDKDFEEFFIKHGNTAIEEKDKVNILKWLEIQRHTMLMYTSCGWFFNDISGIETEQILRYASFALELYSQLDYANLESHFLIILRDAKSNIPKWKDGEFVYEKMVGATRVSVEQIFSCGLFSHLLSKSVEIVPVGTHTVIVGSVNIVSKENSELISGAGEVSSKTVLETIPLEFYSIHDGDGEFKNFIFPAGNGDADVLSLFQSQGYQDTLELLIEKYGAPVYPKRNIFHSHFDKLASELGQSFWLENDELRNKLTESRKSLALLHNKLDTPLPLNALSLSKVFLLEQWMEILNSAKPSIDQIGRMLKFADGIPMDSLEFSAVYEDKMRQLIVEIKRSPHMFEALDRLNAVLGLLDSVPMKINLWKTQNEVFEIFQAHYEGMQKRKQTGDKDAEQWLGKMETTLCYLNMSVSS